MLLNNRKLNDYQISHAVIGKEILSMVGALIDYRSTLAGSKTYDFSEHENLTHHSTTRASYRMQRLRLVLEELGFVALQVLGDTTELASVF